MYLMIELGDVEAARLKDVAGERSLASVAAGIVADVLEDDALAHVRPDGADPTTLAVLASGEVQAAVVEEAVETALLASAEPLSAPQAKTARSLRSMGWTALKIAKSLGVSVERVKGML